MVIENWCSSDNGGQKEELQATTWLTCFTDIILLLRILLNFAKKSLGLEFTPFVQDDENTYYLINGFRYKTYTVTQNPDVLNYPVYDWERGKSASQLFNIALGKVSEKTVCLFKNTFICPEYVLLLQKLTLLPYFAFLVSFFISFFLLY